MFSFIRSHVSAKRERDAALEAASRRIEDRFKSLTVDKAAETGFGDALVGTSVPLPVSVTRSRRPTDRS